ncbi:hypothetical protein RV18_GL001444 [Enterococcus termitis]|nr:hypothetical protein RV18_GL001444 [Enterococcus termitis]
MDLRDVSNNMNNKLLLPKYSIFTLTIILQILMAASLSGWILSRPFFAVIEWLSVLLTSIFFFKINFKSISENYLSRFYSNCSIILNVCSLVFSIGLWILLLTFSGNISMEYLSQILVQMFLSIMSIFFLEFSIYKYIQYRVLQEISTFRADIKTPIFGKLIDKSMIYGIGLIIIAMQYYRINKFWIIGNSSWITKVLIPVGQLFLWLIILLLLIALPIRIFYPNFVKNYILQLYSEEFRNEYGFTEKEWYSG